MGGGAGNGVFEIPLPAWEPGQWHFDLTIEFARPSHGRPYGIEDQWAGALAVPGQQEDKPPPEPEPEPEREEEAATAALASCTTGIFELSANVLGTVEHKGFGGTGRGEVSWEPREWDPHAYSGCSARFLPGKKSAHAVVLLEATGLEWMGLRSVPTGCMSCTGIPIKLGPGSRISRLGQGGMARGRSEVTSAR